MYREFARIHRGLIGHPGFRARTNRRLSWHYYGSAMTARADRHIDHHEPLRAALWLSLAMLLHPDFIRRRLYTWRQIAQLIRV
jgi:hypothetical protein